MADSEKSTHKPGQSVRKGSLLTVGIIVISIVLAVAPSLRGGVYVHGDLAFHLGRIESLYQGLQAGVFPVKVHSALANGFGYGEGFFYPDALLYFPALLRLLGLSLERSYKIYVVSVIMITWLIMYVSLKRILYRKSTFLCACGACVYVLSFRFMHSVYEYGSVGSYTAMAFIPMAISGLLMVLFRPYQKRDLIWLTAGISFVVLSHSTSALITIAFMLLLFLLGIRRLSKRKVRHLVLCAVCGMLATIGYWLPALEQACDQSFYLNSHPAYLLTDNLLDLSDIFRFSGAAELCATVFLMVLLSACLVRRRARAGRSAGVGDKSTPTDGKSLLSASVDQESVPCASEDGEPVLCAVGAASLIFTAAVYCAPLWRLVGGYVQFIQSPARLLGTALAGEILAICLALEREGKRGLRRRQAGYLIMLTLTVLFAAQDIRQMPAYADTVPADSIDYTGIVGLGAGTEWLPDGGSQYAIDETERAVDPEGEGAYGVKYEGDKYFDVYVRMDREYYDMPYFYYKGYAAYLVDEAGHPVQELTVVKAPAERHAYVRVLLPESEDAIGHIIVTYRKTTVQKIAYIINAIFLCGFVCRILYAGLRNGICTNS